MLPKLLYTLRHFYNTSCLTSSDTVPSFLNFLYPLGSKFFRNWLKFFQLCNLGTAKLIFLCVFLSINNQLSFKNCSCISGALYISEIHERHFILHYIGCVFLCIHLFSHLSVSKDSIESKLQKHSHSYYTDRYTNRTSCTA